MQFLTVRASMEGEYRVLWNTGGRGIYGPFRYRVVPDASVERIAIDAVAAPDARDFHAVTRFIGHIAEGVRCIIESEAQERGRCLCCARIEVIDMKSHVIDTHAAGMELYGLSFGRFLLEDIASLHSILPEPWLTSDVVALARGIHASATFDGLWALHDALVEAGCDDPLVIEHLRTCADHSPSCWVVEMILEAEGKRLAGV